LVHTPQCGQQTALWPCPRPHSVQVSLPTKVPAPCLHESLIVTLKLSHAGMYFTALNFYWFLADPKT